MLGLSISRQFCTEDHLQYKYYRIFPHWVLTDIFLPQKLLRSGSQLWCKLTTSTGLLYLRLTCTFLTPCMPQTCAKLRDKQIFHAGRRRKTASLDMHLLKPLMLWYQRSSFANNCTINQGNILATSTHGRFIHTWMVAEILNRKSAISSRLLATY